MSIGERLKKEREKKGMTLEDVHSRLRIHPAVLFNIEENNFEALPAPIYTKGFIKRYGEFLEINPEELITEYDSIKTQPKDMSFAVGLQKDASKPPLKVQDPAKLAQMPRRWAPLVLRAVGVGVAIALVLFGGQMILNSLKGIAAHRPQKSPVASKAVPPSGDVLKLETSDTPSADFVNSPEQGNYPKIKPKDTLKLVVTASTDAWVRISADGQIVLETILKPRERKEFTALKLFELKLGRPAGISLSINGYPLGAPGEGQAKHVILTHQGLKKLK